MNLFSWGLLFVLALTAGVLAMIFSWLAVRYGTTVGYVTLALAPPTAFFLLLKFQQYLGHLPETLFPETFWLSLITFVFGLVLMIRAFRRKERWGVLLFAAIVSLAPFALVVFMLYQMSRDEFLKSL
jgi:hypothetical protein